MSNIYDSYIGQKTTVSYDDRCKVVFSDTNTLAGRLEQISLNDKNNTAFLLSFSFESAAVYYFGIKAKKIIISNGSKQMAVEADDLTVSAVSIDRSNNRYAMIIEAKNEKYIRD